MVCVIENDWLNKNIIGRLHINEDKRYEHIYYMKIIPMYKNLPWFDINEIEDIEIGKYKD